MAVQSGTVIVVASGNEYMPIFLIRQHESVIVVGAVDNNGQRGNSNEYGAGIVDIYKALQKMTDQM